MMMIWTAFEAQCLVSPPVVALARSRTPIHSSSPALLASALNGGDSPTTPRHHHPEHCIYTLVQTWGYHDQTAFIVISM